MTKCLMIIPCFNEAENILKTVSTILNFKTDLAQIDYVIINDCSTDNTLNVILENNLNHINLIENLGIGGAVQTGYKYALLHNYDFACQFDGDGQHNIESLENLLKPLLENEADLVIGSRFINNEENFKSSLMRRLGINFLSYIIFLVCKLKIYDTTSGFRVCNQKTIKEFANNYPLKYPEPESLVFLHKNNFKIKETFAKMNAREFGSSSITSFKAMFYMLEVSLAILIEGVL